MSERKTIYASLNVCQCNFQNKPLQTQKQLNSLGDSTNIFLNIYLPANSAFVSAMSDKDYPSGNKFFNIPTITLGINYGVIAFLFKKEAEGKSIERATTETALEFTTSYFGGMGGKALATRVATKFSITMAGRMLGGYAGSLVPIAGTIVGAVAGGWIAGKIEEWWFSDEEQALAEAKAENERIRKLEEAYFLKINRIINYLITHQYIELRVLNEDEAEKLCKEISDINSAYFKTILLMLSFPYYLDKDEQSYKEAQEKNPTIIRIQPIANALNIKIEINECFLAKNGEALKNKEIYVYNHRFDRVVTKAMSDDEGKIVFENVYVGKESTIDKISFIIDRENFNEDNFYESVLKYAPMFNVQKKHKQEGQAFIGKMFFSFTYAQEIMQDNEVLKLEALRNNFHIVFDYEVRKQEESYKNYIILSYLVFDVKEDIEEYIRHITIENRAFRGLELLGRGWKNQYSIKDEWRDKGVVFFAYFNSQKFTPYKKMAFIDKPIVILDIEKFDKEDILKDIKFHFKTLAKAYKIFVIDLDANTQIQEKKSIVNNIKKNTQNLELLYLQLKLFDDKDTNKCKVQYFHNENKYANQEMKWIEYCKKQFNALNNKDNPIYKNKNSFDMEVPFVSISFGSLIYDKERLAKKGVRQIFGVGLAESCRRYFYEK
ncbi:hypothetical protein [Campylobacter coli]|uniref:hypothetical protein n=1 Tax=Campylobacter coli TaxID=195 RepID=UPI00092F3D10|nr:hypothetical protein [Campylobacter coli]HEB7545927.1 hypothetical protein [Campylobacter coli]HEB7552916.1 hypothetical protein [Campylobacter coli]